jgi:hypothetical protein
MLNRMAPATAIKSWNFKDSHTAYQQKATARWRGRANATFR